MFVARKIAFLPIFVAVFGCVALVGWAGEAAPSGLLAASPFQPAESLLHRADTFPRCAKVKSCWRNDYGRLKCGYSTRCQECKYVKRCTRIDGCRWREVCKWGPYKPVLPTN